MRKSGALLVAMAACAAMAGCVPKVDVSATADVQSRYTHVWLTIQEIWFNTDDTATPADSTWDRFTLGKPITVDLAALTRGDLEQIASNLELKADTYKQIRLIRSMRPPR
ncbi:MAG: DUF4382 domain-containing protein [Pseudomonadota bacterium]